GGLAALTALNPRRRLHAGVELVVACDVQTLFVDAAEVYAPQKGATAAQGLERAHAAVGYRGEVTGRASRHRRPGHGCGHLGGTGRAAERVGRGHDEHADYVGRGG
ncbi:MAG TPA: glycerate kinase, partial [Acidimicrobiales bacterium]|nr:glycerate kinase [Acidimicrobiales bacterium]